MIREHLISPRPVKKVSSFVSLQDATPWRAFLRNTPVRALAYTHFCNNWCVPPLLALLRSTEHSESTNQQYTV